MTMIKCGDCEHQVSTKAKTCPSCGAPVELPPATSIKDWFSIERIDRRIEKAEKAKKSAGNDLIGMLAFIVLIGVIVWAVF